MNKFFISAETGVFGLASDEARESLLQRCFKNLRFRRTARSKAEPMAGDDSHLIEERNWEPDKHQPPIYYLATMHPHIVAASLFSKKSR